MHAPAVASQPNGQVVETSPSPVLLQSMRSLPSQRKNAPGVQGGGSRSTPAGGASLDERSASDIGRSVELGFSPSRQQVLSPAQWKPGGHSPVDEHSSPPLERSGEQPKDPSPKTAIAVETKQILLVVMTKTAIPPRRRRSRARAAARS